MAVYLTNVADDFSAIGDLYADSTTYTVTGAGSRYIFMRTGGGEDIEIAGTFRYTSSGDLNLSASTFTRVRYWDADGNLIGSLSAKLPAATAAYYANRNDDTGLAAYIFRGNDKITGSQSADVLYGYKGNDTLYGRGGDDTLNGQQGRDKMIGGNGDDIYIVDHRSDRAVETSGGVNSGVDLVKSSVSFSLGSNVENLVLTGKGNIKGVGNSEDNVLTGNSRDNLLQGKGGDDTLKGGNGADRLQGGSGDDYLTGGSGNDRLEGGSGSDRLNGGSGRDTMIGGSGDDTYYVNHRDDRIVESRSGGSDTVVSTISYTLGSNLENLTLSGSADHTAKGNSLANVLTGNRGDNTLLGLSGSDILDGAAGDDVLDGGSGNDTLIGGVGVDVLTGGAGSDVFRFDSLSHSGVGSAARDRILDFTRGEDKIDLGNIDADATDGAFSEFSGTLVDVFTAPEQLRFDANTGILSLNTDDDAEAEMEIALVGVDALDASDFVNISAPAPNAVAIITASSAEFSVDVELIAADKLVWADDLFV